MEAGIRSLMFVKRMQPRHWFGVRKLSVNVNDNKKKRVAVAMSGGIDSTATAIMLQDQGYDCIGVFMKNWDVADESDGEACTLSQDKEDMEEVCKLLHIPTKEVTSISLSPLQTNHLPLFLLLGEFCQRILGQCI